jgi:hypothetical protein
VAQSVLLDQQRFESGLDDPARYRCTDA